MSADRLIYQTALLLGLLLVALPVCAHSAGKDLTRQAELGENLFQQKCAGCHTIGADKSSVGPDLSGVSERRERQWLVNFITDPGKVITAGDATANALLKQFNNLTMPTIALDSEQMDSLLTYLAHPEEAAQHAPAAEATTPAADPDRGEALFVGEVAMTNGGAPCIACHATAGVGLAGNSNYGPDLSAIYENYGEEGIASILESLPFPSMEAIFAKRPLTAAERADLLAFFARTAKLSEPPSPGLLTLQVIFGIAVLLIITLLIGRRRMGAVRRPLVGKQRNLLHKGGLQ